VRDKIGINIGQGHYVDWFLDNGFKHFKVDGLWAQVEQDGYLWLEDTLRKIKDAGGATLLGLYAIPARLDPSQQLIRGWSFPSISIWKPQFTQEWQLYVSTILERYAPLIDLVYVGVETNIRGLWRQPDDMGNRSARDFLSYVVDPVEPIIKAAGKKLVSGSPTLRGDNRTTYREAIKHFLDFKHHSHGIIDHLDFHAYRDIADDLIDDIEETLTYVNQSSKVMITETGFDEKECFHWWERLGRRLSGKAPYTGEQKQERNYKVFMEWLKKEDRVRRVYLFRSHDPVSGMTYGKSGLLHPDGTPKPAALLIRRYVNGEI